MWNFHFGKNFFFFLIFQKILCFPSQKKFLLGEGKLKKIKKKLGIFFGISKICIIIYAEAAKVKNLIPCSLNPRKQGMRQKEIWAGALNRCWPKLIWLFSRVNGSHIKGYCNSYFWCLHNNTGLWQIIWFRQLICAQLFQVLFCQCFLSQGILIVFS